jgi:lysophospholipase L1-like esterase
VLRAGHQIAGDIPLLIVNEPILISNGQNSDIRYNFFYPRWAYDQYRVIMAEQARQQGWRYLDLWDLVPMTEFTNSAVHLTPAGSQLLAERIAQTLR